MESVDLAARLSSTEVEYPWGPMPQTDEAKTWQMELDFVDVFEGSIEELEELARKAPTRDARLWLLSLIHWRKMLRALADWPPPRPAPVPAQDRDEDEEQQPASQVQPVPKKNAMPSL